MKAISVHVDEEAYEAFKSLARREERPVAALMRDAMGQYLDRHRQRGSVLDLPTFESGPLLRPWSREELLDEMRGAAVAREETVSR